MPSVMPMFAVSLLKVRSRSRIRRVSRAAIVGARFVLHK
jgi:hypothetical protein